MTTVKRKITISIEFEIDCVSPEHADELQRQAEDSLENLLIMEGHSWLPDNVSMGIVGS